MININICIYMYILLFSRHRNCLMFQDLLSLSKKLEKDLCKSQGNVMHLLQPQFCLIGSMAEGTRIGLANELDISMVFKAWKGNAPFKVENDAFSLTKSDKNGNKLPWMSIEQVFHGGKYFSQKFLHEGYPVGHERFC